MNAICKNQLAIKLIIDCDHITYVQHNRIHKHYKLNGPDFIGHNGYKEWWVDGKLFKRTPYGLTTLTSISNEPIF